MSRELNRELFGELTAITTAPAPRPAPAQTPAPPTRSSDGLAIATTEDLKVIGFQVESMGRKLKEFESKIEMLSAKWEEFSQMAKLRFERIQGHFQRQSEGMQSSFRDVHNKVATVASRINERKMVDSSMQDMMDRHNQVVETLETRLEQMQKVITEQELELMHSKSEMRDLLKEFAKLRRG